VDTNLSRGHLRVGINFFSSLLKSFALVLARAHHAIANLP
jgi:hypothetical protein